MTNIVLCTLCLNESEFLRKSYEQHKDWPGLTAWIFIEAADPLYAKANPGLVTQGGLSTDGTSEILRDLARNDPRVIVGHYGWMQDANSAQNKTRGRDEYIVAMEDLPHPPGLFLVLDADEFYCRNDQPRITAIANGQHASKTLCWRLPQRHIWHPPSIEQACVARVFDQEVRGGYWDVPHVRLFRWSHGIRYRRDHNWPDAIHYHPLRHVYNGSISRGDPQCVHMGFARAARERLATNRYYKERGEGKADGRQMYVDCRSSWETWEPGKTLPLGARVVNYDGPVPECYQRVE